MRIKGLAEATQRPGLFDRRRAAAFRAVGARRIAATGAVVARSGIFGACRTLDARESLSLLGFRFGILYPFGTDACQVGGFGATGIVARLGGHGGQSAGTASSQPRRRGGAKCMINLSIPKDEQELKPRITVVGVGGAGGNAVNNMIRSNLVGCEFVVVQHRRAGAAAVGGAAQDPARHRRDARARRRRPAGCRPRRRRGGARRDPRSDAGLQHGVHHRRHGRRHRHRCGAR